MAGIAGAVLLVVLVCGFIRQAESVVSVGNPSVLMVSGEDLPWEAVLSDLRMDARSPKMGLLEFSQPLRRFRQSWSGPPTGKPGTLLTRQRGADVELAVATSQEEAVSIALQTIYSASVTIPEVTGESRVAPFANRAWYGDNASGGSTATSGGVVFVQGNVVASVHLSSKDGIDSDVLFALASRLGRRIHAALSGSPEPVPILPLAADQELRVDLEDAWKMRDLGKRLWGDQAVTVAIYDADGIPRSIPAKRLGANDYIVPLRHVAAILGPRTPVEIEGDEVKTNIKGKPLVFGKGRSQARVGKQTVQLSRPVEFADGEVLVPLISVIHSALSKQIAWEDRGSIKIGRVR